MVFRCRWYPVAPGRGEAFASFFRDYLLPVQQRYGATLIGRWQTDDGGRVLALWAYRSREEYEAIQTKVAADPDSSRAKAYRRDALGDNLYTACEEYFLSSTVPLEMTALAGVAASLPGDKEKNT